MKTEEKKVPLEAQQEVLEEDKPQPEARYKHTCPRAFSPQREHESGDREGCTVNTVMLFVPRRIFQLLAME